MQDVGLRRHPARRALRSRAAGSTQSVSPSDLEDFYRNYFLPLVWRATYKHGLAKEDARDVVQEAFILAMSKLRTDGNPRAWLNQVVDHLSISQKRKTSRRAYLAVKWGLHDSITTEPRGASEDEGE